MLNPGKAVSECSLKNPNFLHVPCFVVLKSSPKVPSSSPIFLKALAAALLGSPGSTEAGPCVYRAADMLQVLPFKSMLIGVYASVISSRSCSLRSTADRLQFSLQFSRKTEDNWQRRLSVLSRPFRKCIIFCPLGGCGRLRGECERERVLPLGESNPSHPTHMVVTLDAASLSPNCLSVQENSVSGSVSLGPSQTSS